MRTIKKIIIFFVAFAIALSGVGLYYVYFTKEGILWRHDLSRDTVKLTMRINNFQFYLYEKESEFGILQVYKRENGLGWKLNQYQPKELMSDRDSIEFIYPAGYQNGAAVFKSLWGGVLKNPSSYDVKIKFNEVIYSPDFITFMKDEYLYFFVKNDTTGQTITIEN